MKDKKTTQKSETKDTSQKKEKRTNYPLSTLPSRINDLHAWCKERGKTTSVYIKALIKKDSGIEL